MNKAILFIAALALATVLQGSPASAANVTLGVAGRVSIELVSSDATFHNTIALASPTAAVATSGCNLEASTGLPGLALLSEKTSQHGCRVDLDSDPGTPGIQGFPANAVLRFNMCAQTDSDPDCEHVWSSDPALNSDGDDHVQTTAIRPVEFPGQIFQLGWEDQQDLGDMDFNDLIVVVRVNVDTDGDGLWDDWEQFGIDTDGDGTIDLDLPALGANRLRKNVFLEIDFMDCAVAGGDCAAGDTHSHRPSNAAVNAVVQAFANANVTNPDLSTGVTLRIDVGNSIRHQNALNIPGACFNGGAGIGSFDAVKADPANFGPTNPRRFAYHYALFTHRQLAGDTTSGCGELPGNDFQVALGGWNYACAGGVNANQFCATNADCPGSLCQAAGDTDGDGVADADVGTLQQQAGTLMHELGHNLNLRHGGGDFTNYKPNYLSIMNYWFQMPGIPPTDPDGPGQPLTGRIDYSRSALATLVETNLNEPTGIGDGTDNTFFLCPNGTTTQQGAGTGAVDWDCDTDGGVENSVSVDINGDQNLSCVRAGPNGVLDTPPAGDDVVFSGDRIREGANRQCDTTATGDDLQTRPIGPLVGFNDWSAVKLDFQNAKDFEDGVHTARIDMIDIDVPTFMDTVAPDPAIAMTVSPDPVLTGSDLTYTITLTNDRPSVATDVLVVDDLPADTTFVSCAATGGGICGGSGNSRTITFPSLAAGALEVITLVTNVNCAVADGTLISNSATVSTMTPDADVSNNTASAQAEASNPPPVISNVLVDTPILWPPNHRLVPIKVSYTVTDNCGLPGNTLAVASNEPVNGLGDGDTAPDWAILDANRVLLRAERAGRGMGRVYTITLTSTDSASNSSSTTVEVRVPKSQRN